MDLNHYKAMCQYNQWMNEKIYKVCSGLSDEERKKNRLAFFKSIHGTLNHILLADLVWISRLEVLPFQIKSLDQELYSDFNELQENRMHLDEKIIKLIDSYTNLDLTRILSYKGIANPKPRQYPIWFVLSHFFNHQTHHRGQITTLLSQMGLDIGSTDLLMLPDFQNE
ncbi:DinB family protein [Leptospira sp. GIMC2001]|uniref:DinB family protein n=1 Tax=Leptospira sp. GIMC2001 TaxID=1513297 RepID=UPI002349EE99|nr:DinB family protein [Leptospira sp. GIMC2001]WCL50611.1 DinB family protein [Leptospira sp. GIMC2001]